MINNGNDIGFIHDIAGLDKLRQQAVKGDEASEKEALTAAAKQFESIFAVLTISFTIGHSKPVNLSSSSGVRSVRPLRISPIFR